MKVALVIFSVSAALLILQVVYPAFLWLISLVLRNHGEVSTEVQSDTLKVSVLVPVYAKDINLLAEKLVNTSNLNYSPSHLEIIVSGDGHLPELPLLVEKAPNRFPVRFNETGTWVGKNRAMNETVKLAEGDVIVVTDVDTSLPPDAVTKIVSRLNDPEVGGVCGTVTVDKVGQAKSGLGRLQQHYWKYEWWIKNTEMNALGSVTSCSGQLLAIRRDFYPGLPQDVNDDLFLALSVVARGRRFLAAPDALAYIPPPSKTLKEELRRRPRIVAGGLTAIWRNRRIFVRGSTFSYGLCLFLHKVIRRLTPVFMALLFLTNGVLAFRSGIFLILFVGQLMGYGLAILAFKGILKGKLFGTLSYFLAFNIGTARGLFEFLFQKGRSKW